ncbi:hypothetical protein PV797_19090 [Clostridiaceae bacterium M8S5]|nr:hypothetical protein PV797_19090 [Clostridiaceae bacterium M8S5]
MKKTVSIILVVALVLGLAGLAFAKVGGAKECDHDFIVVKHKISFKVIDRKTEVTYPGPVLKYYELRQHYELRRDECKHCDSYREYYTVKGEEWVCTGSDH